MNNRKTYCLEVWGPMACFTHPMCKAERWSYDVITPAAARGIFETILWKKGAMKWEITKIEVMNPIKRGCIMRNEVSAQCISPKKYQPVSAADCRTQRRTNYLKDVCYRIYADLVFIPVGARDKSMQNREPGADELPKKYFHMFERRVANGQVYNHQPYFGCKEFPAYFKMAENDGRKPIQESCSFGPMVYDYDYNTDERYVRTYIADMKNGVIEVKNPIKNQ